jgi:hypothetical protein
VDFDARAIRTYELTEDSLLFEGDDRDGLLAQRARAPEPPAASAGRGETLPRLDLEKLTARERWLRVRYA